MLGKRPPDSLANFRWLGPVPDELKDLTWIEEMLVAHAHVVGRVVRLQACNQASYFGIKGHIILLPQECLKHIQHHLVNQCSPPQLQQLPC